MPSETSPRAVGSRLLRTGSVYAFASLVNRGATFILLPIYSRCLSPAQFGVVNLAETIAVVLGTIAVMGLPSALEPIYFKHPRSSAEQTTVVAATLRLTLGLAAGFGVLFLAAGPSVMHSILPSFSVPFHPFIAVALIAAVCTQTFQLPLVIARAQEQAGRFVALSLGHFGLSTAGTLMLVVALSWGSFGMLFARAVAAAIVATVGLWTLRGWLLSGHSGQVSKRQACSDALQLAVPLLPHQMAAFVIEIGNRFFIEHYRSTEEVGLYSMAYSVGSVMNVVNTTILMAWSPVYFQKARQGGANVKILGDVGGALIGGLVIIAAIGAAFGPIAMRFLLDARYTPAGPAAAFVIAGNLLHGLLSLFLLAIMHSGKTQYLAAATALAAAVSLIANFFLVPSYGFIGGTWATLIAYAIECVLVFVMATRLFPVAYPWRRILLWLAGFGAVLAMPLLVVGPTYSAVAGGLAVLALSCVVWLSGRGCLRGLRVAR